MHFSASTQLNMKMRFYYVITVQGSHREGSKQQNKDLSAVPHSMSSNLNNPNSLSGGKNVATATTADSDANHNSGPYFDVAASKNVCIILPRSRAYTCCTHFKLLPHFFTFGDHKNCSENNKKLYGYSEKTNINFLNIGHSIARKNCLFEL